MFNSDNKQRHMPPICSLITFTFEGSDSIFPICFLVMGVAIGALVRISFDAFSTYRLLNSCSGLVAYRYCIVSPMHKTQ